jgi:hypothetical protein
MAVDVEKVVERIDDWMDQADEADNTEETIYYGNKAIALGLVAILTELSSIRKEIAKRQCPEALKARSAPAT